MMRTVPWVAGCDGPSCTRIGGVCSIVRRSYRGAAVVSAA